jgi:serine protease Do
MKVPFKALTLFAAALALAGAAQAATGKAAMIDDKKIEDITRLTAPSVVRVEARDGIRKVATGVVLDKDGFIATTALISPRDEEIRITTSDGKSFKAEFKGFDTQTGIALLQVKDKGLAPIAMGKSADMKPGAWIGVIGLSPEATPAVTQGIVSSVSPTGLRLNVWVVPGSSGSPVVNGDGRMVGLLRGTYTDDQPVLFEFRERTTVGSGFAFSRGEGPSAGLALAVPMDVVASVAADIKKNGKVLRGWLGVSTGDLDGKIVIAGVEPKSPADLAKLKEDDVILKIDGKDQTTGQGLTQEVRSRKPGAEVTLKIERDGKPLDVKVKLGEYSEDNAKRELEIRFPSLFPQILPRPPKSGTPPPAKSPFETFRWEKRKFIDTTLQPMNKELAEAWGAKDGYGLLVVALGEEGPARKAGLKVGDIILKADGKKVEEVADLSGLLQDKKKGDKVKLDVVRDKKALTIEVPVAEDEKSSTAIIRGPEDLAALMQEREAKTQAQIEKMIQDYRKHEIIEPQDDYWRKRQWELQKGLSDELIKKMKGDRMLYFI